MGMTLAASTFKRRWALSATNSVTCCTSPSLLRMSTCTPHHFHHQFCNPTKECFLYLIMQHGLIPSCTVTTRLCCRPAQLQGQLLSSQAYLVDQKHHFLAPLPDVFQKIDFALCEGPISAHHKQHHVSSRHIFLSQALLPVKDDISARSVYDVHLLQQLGGKVPYKEAVLILNDLFLTLLSKLEDADLICGWQNTLRQESAQQRWEVDCHSAWSFRLFWCSYWHLEQHMLGSDKQGIPSLQKRAVCI